MQLCVLAQGTGEVQRPGLGSLALTGEVQRPGLGALALPDAGRCVLRAFLKQAHHSQDKHS